MQKTTRKRPSEPIVRSKNSVLPIFSLLNLSLPRKLFCVFLAISAIIIVVALNAQLAFINSERTVGVVLHNYHLLRHLKDGHINLANAGQIPDKLESRLWGVEAIEAEMQVFKERFAQIASELLKIEVSPTERQHTILFIDTGNRFYEALADFFPIKKMMLAHYTLYDNQPSPLYEIVKHGTLLSLQLIHELENLEADEGIEIDPGYRHFDEWINTVSFKDEQIANGLVELKKLHHELDALAKLAMSTAGNGLERKQIRREATAVSSRLNAFYNDFYPHCLTSYNTIADEFRKQKIKLNLIYEESVDALTVMEDLVEHVSLEGAIAAMHATIAKSKRLVLVISTLGVIFSLVIGYYVGNRVGRAFMLTEETNEELRRFNLLLEEEVGKRKAAEKDLARAFKALENLADSDGLTGLYNYRFLMNYLENECARASRHHLKLSMLMIDLDNFKNINDVYGHSCGDSILQEIANLLKGSVRKTDLVARYGGEELTIVMPETALPGAEKVAEVLRRKVEGHPFRFEGSTVSTTVSIGVAAFAENDNHETFLKKADSALYRAKGNGRNRVEIHPA